MGELNSGNLGYAYLVMTFLMFGFMGSVAGLRVIALGGMSVFTFGLFINRLLMGPKAKGEKVTAEDLCGCRLRL